MKGEKDNGPSHFCFICLMEYRNIRIEKASTKRCKGLPTADGRETDLRLNSEHESRKCYKKDAQSSSSLFATEENEDKDSSINIASCTVSIYDLGTDGDDGEEGLSSNHKRSFYQLESCQHSMCTSCLASYCASKVKDGKTEINCCAPILDEKDKMSIQNYCGITTPPETPFSLPPEIPPICPKLITENDILFLLDFYDKEEEYPSNSICWKPKHTAPSSGSTLIERYKRYKFDSKHKENARRCPNCDHPRIFQMIGNENNPDESISDITGSDQGINNIMKLNNFSRWFHKSEEKTIAKKTTKAKTEDVEKRSQDEESVLPQNNRKTSPTLTKEDVQPQSNIDFENTDDIESANTTSQVPICARLRPMVPVVNCVECDTEFCFYHSNAHVGRTCEQYEETMKKEDDKLNDYLKKSGSKQCPNCGTHIQKDGGCNHVKCSNCGICFCWLCRAVVEDSTFPSHFQWWNLRGCPNLQLREGEDPSQLTILFSKIISTFQVIIIGPPAVILAAITSALCCCCIPGSTIKERISNSVSFWGNAIIMIFILVAIFCFSSFLAIPFFIGAVLYYMFPCLQSNERSNDSNSN